MNPTLQSWAQSRQLRMRGHQSQTKMLSLWTMARESLRGSQSHMVCFHLSHNSFAGLIYAVYYCVYTEHWWSGSITKSCVLRWSVCRCQKSSCLAGKMASQVPKGQPYLCLNKTRYIFDYSMVAYGIHMISRDELLHKSIAIVVLPCVVRMSQRIRQSLEMTKNKQIQALSRWAVGFSSLNSLKDTHSNIFDISFSLSILVYSSKRTKRMGRDGIQILCDSNCAVRCWWPMGRGSRRVGRRICLWRGFSLYIAIAIPIVIGAL